LDKDLFGGIELISFAKINFKWARLIPDQQAHLLSKGGTERFKQSWCDSTDLKGHVQGILERGDVFLLVGLGKFPKLERAEVEIAMVNYLLYLLEGFVEIHLF